MREWFAPIDRPALCPETARVLALVLRWTTGLLLIGHGGYGTYLHKPMLVQQVASIGQGHPQEVVTLVGLLEILLGIGILARPFGPVLLFVAGWKVLTELLYPLSGAPIWEFIERGGSYVAPLALYVLLACCRNRGCETEDQTQHSPQNALPT